VAEAAIDVYRDAFVARGRHEVRGEAPVRLLVTDDGGFDDLVAAVAGARRGRVTVFEGAERCHAFLRGLPGWSADRPTTAMVLRDLRAVPAAALPDGFVLLRVDRGATAAPDAVPLRDAAAVGIAADSGITDPIDDFTAYLDGLPGSVRFFAAVDGERVARATSAYQLFGEHARIFFVNTERPWRRRGIGRAMTVHALGAAAAVGAHSAFLHATVDGASVYERLGFETAGRLTQYFRVG
jgi:ribosomal protein S18 acetylase RimI-like enzyme